jgi:hypothetical protein
MGGVKIMVSVVVTHTLVLFLGSFIGRLYAFYQNKEKNKKLLSYDNIIRIRKSEQGELESWIEMLGESKTKLNQEIEKLKKREKDIKEQYLEDAKFEYRKEIRDLEENLEIKKKGFEASIKSIEDQKKQAEKDLQEYIDGISDRKKNLEKQFKVITEHSKTKEYKNFSYFIRCLKDAVEKSEYDVDYEACDLIISGVLNSNKIGGCTRRVTMDDILARHDIDLECEPLFQSALTYLYSQEILSSSLLKNHAGHEFVVPYVTSQENLNKYEEQKRFVKLKELVPSNFWNYHVSDMYDFGKSLKEIMKNNGIELEE